MNKNRKKTNKANSIKVKVQILDDVESKQFTYQQIADKYEVTPSTVRDYVRDKAKIREQSIHISGNRCRVRQRKFFDLEERLFDSYTHLRSGSLPATGPWLKHRAKELADEMKISDFHGSNKWLSAFMKQYHLSVQKPCGESAKVNKDIVSNWLEENKALLEQYSPRDIYNADETGFYYRCLPSRTIELKGQKCHGGSMSKERVTALVCCNMDGTDKTELLIIGVSKSPRCFPKKRKNENYSLAQLKCHYRSQKNAWMDRSIFSEWLLMLESKFAKENRQVLLLLDNFSGHKVPSVEVNLKHIKVLFLPADTTSVCQPLDQGIIHSLKSIYKSDLLQFYWTQLNSQPKGTKLKPVNLRHGINLLISAWESVKSETISNCFRHGLTGIHSTEPISPDLTLTEIPIISKEVLQALLSGDTTFNDFAFADSELLTSDEVHFQSTTAIDSENQFDSHFSTETNSIDLDEEEEEPPIKHSQAIEAIGVLLKYTSYGDQANCQLHKDLSRYLKTDVIRAYYSEKKQTDIRSFFSVNP